MSRTTDSEDAFEDLLWELDVTSVRGDGHPGPHAPTPLEPRSVQPRGPEPIAPHSRFGRRARGGTRAPFARPELESVGERLARNPIVLLLGGLLLLGGTSALVAVALTRY